MCVCMKSVYVCMRVRVRVRVKTSRECTTHKVRNTTKACMEAYQEGRPCNALARSSTGAARSGAPQEVAGALPHSSQE
jgi:hypothetical protein